MSRVYERSPVRHERPIPDEVVLEATPDRGRLARMVGALGVLVVGAVHLEQYFGVHFDVVPTIGPLFALNFAGAIVIGLGLLAPLRRLHPLLALGGIALATTSFVFFFVSEHQSLFGFQDYGYRPAIIVALVAEVVAVLSLGVYLTARARAR